MGYVIRSQSIVSSHGHERSFMADHNPWDVVSLGMSWTEIGLIVIVVVVLFGRGNRLPEMARSLGKAIGEFKRAMSPSEPPVDFDPEENTERDGAQPDEPGDDNPPNQSTPS
jgi:TatA/E family protein of Tat protein translocase